MYVRIIAIARGKPTSYRNCPPPPSLVSGAQGAPLGRQKQLPALAAGLGGAAHVAPATAR
jgi:hypothetical protein